MYTIRLSRRLSALTLGLSFVVVGVAAAATPAPACKMQCDSARLTCNQHEAKSLTCGHQYAGCIEHCGGAKPAKVSPVQSCRQRCDEAGAQCGIGNVEDSSRCASGRDACVARCGTR